MLLAVNRIILKTSLGVSPEKHASSILPCFAFECFRVFVLAGVFAVSIVLMLKLMRLAARPNASLSGLLALTLKSQAVYLFAAPIALLALSLNPWLSSSIMTQVSQFLKSFFPIATFVALFFLLKKHLPDLGEVRVLVLILAPYLFLVGILLAFLAALAAFLTVLLIR